MDAACVISVIVPVYNVEKYVQRCVKSILAQTFQNIEIILIDDGSDDMSGEYCDALAKEDSRVKVVHQKNGGLSAARNKGLEIAIGEWISFIDSDDFIHPRMLESMLADAIQSQAAIAVCGVANVNEEGVCIRTYVPEPQILEGEALHRYFLEIGREYVSDKLFHASLLKSIRFPIGKLYEDGFVLTYLLEAAHRAVFVNEIGYYYTQRKTSITNTRVKKGMDISSQMDALEARQSKLEFMKTNYPALVPKAKKDVLLTCCWLLYKTYKARGINFNQHKTLILDTFKKEKRGSEKNGFMIFCAVWLISLSPRLFCIMYGILENIKKAINTFVLKWGSYFDKKVI